MPSGKTTIDPTPTLAYGILSVRLLVQSISTFWPPEDISVYDELPSTSILISTGDTQPASAPPNLITLVTKSNGSLSIELPVANNYVVAINDPRFHLNVPFQILPNETTKITATFMRQAYPVTFQEYTDRFATGYSGGAGDTVSLLINSKISVAKVHDGVTLEVLRGVAIHQVQATVVGESLTGGALFLQVQPEEGMKVGGNTEMSVVVYNPTYAVTVNSG